MVDMKQKKTIAELRAHALARKPDEKIERIAMAVAPIVQAAILTIAVLLLVGFLH